MVSCHNLVVNRVIIWGILFNIVFSSFLLSHWITKEKLFQNITRTIGINLLCCDFRNTIIIFLSQSISLRAMGAKAATSYMYMKSPLNSASLSRSNWQSSDFSHLYWEGPPWTFNIQRYSPRTTRPPLFDWHATIMIHSSHHSCNLTFTSQEVEGWRQVNGN